TRCTGGAGCAQRDLVNGLYGGSPWGWAGISAGSNVLDDFNREGLGIEVDFSLPAERVIRSLNRIIEWRGKPSTIMAPNISVENCWNGLKNKELASSTSNPVSRNRTPTSSATT